MKQSNETADGTAGLEEREVVVRIYEDFAAGLSAHAIAAALNSEGVSAPGGGRL